MPIHDWSRFSDGTFHAFHLNWMSQLQGALKRLLPKGYYALAEQDLIGLGPDVLTLQKRDAPPLPAAGGKATMAPPRTAFEFRMGRASYTAAQRRLVIRHKSGRRVVAIIELVSAGNKSSQHKFDKFLENVGGVLSQGVHALVIDLQASTPRDPRGVHAALWESLGGEEFVPPADRPLTLASYEGEPALAAHVEPVAAGMALPDMPLYLGPDYYVLVPLERTYAAAFDLMPEPEDLE
ncbi:MAG: DUF4058 family protein [Gemmataceae bacterium]|nr:DUF4058 family protein [Gemmataceae bacterium]